MAVDTAVEPLGARVPSEGVVTLMQTDIEGSTQLLEALGDDYPLLIQRSRELTREALARFDGIEIDASGDAFFATFESAADALRAAIWIQKHYHQEPWPQRAATRVRIGLHTGRPQFHVGGYFGLDVHRTARIMAAAGGGQILLSAATRAALADAPLPDEVQLRDLGSHRLKDLRYPEVLFDVVVGGLPPTFGALRSADSQPNNLPLPPTPFIGRERLLEDVRQAILGDRVRLLTLTGPGGTGKTRLAIEAARTLHETFPHGVFLVSLVSLTDARLIPSVIVQTLGLPEFGNKTPLETLVHHLASREMLLLLDNFEQILAGGSDLTALLNGCPKVRVVVTSREPLNVRWERLIHVQPLGLPQRGDGATLDECTEVESVRLFVDRASTFDASFELTTANAAVVAAICRRLDGLPLAIELAASWLALYTPEQLLARLQKGTDLLAHGPRDVAHHQRTLHDLIEWGYNLLDERDQIVFRRMAVFAGGCTVSSAAEVVADGDVSADVAISLVSLVRKSLLTQTVVDGERRMGMLQTIREFSTNRLAETPEQHEIRGRHAGHYLALAEEMAPLVTGREQRRAVTRLMAEQDNLRAALAWAIERHDIERTSRLLTALLWLWIPRGQFAEGKAWARRALEAFGDQRTREVGLMLEVAGWLDVLSGDYLAGLPVFERSHTLLAESSEAVDRVRTRVTLGVACLVLGDERGGGLSDEAVALGATTTDPTVKGFAALSAGIKQQMQGDGEGAVRAYQESLKLFRSADNVFWSGTLLQNLAVLRLQEGNLDGATALAFDALDIAREYDYPMNKNVTLTILGSIALAGGNAALGAKLFAFVDTSLAQLGVSLEPPEQAVLQANTEEARRQLGAEVFEALSHAGRAWRERDVLDELASLRPRGARLPSTSGAAAPRTT